MGRCPPTAPPGGYFSALNKDLQKYFNSSLAANTDKTYETGKRKFLQFCKFYQVPDPIIPTTESILCYFVVHLARTVQHDTIKVYLSATKHLHLQQNYNLELDKFIRLQYVLRGIKRSQTKSTKIRLPILQEHMEMFFHLLQPFSVRNHDNIMIWAAMCLAFFGFLRTSEFTVDRLFQDDKHLGKRDIVFEPSLVSPVRMTVNVKCSKTDPFRKGIKLTIGKTGKNVCAVNAVKHYLTFLDNKEQKKPLFTCQDGKPLSRTRFVKEVQNLLEMSGANPLHFNGHSFRIGAATAAAAAGLPSWLIKNLGRWTSDCYERYVRTPVSVLEAASKALVKSDKNN